MSLPSIGGKWDSKMLATDVPFLYAGREHVWKVNDGPVGKELMNRFEPLGAKPFCYGGGWGFRGRLGAACRGGRVPSVPPRRHHPKQGGDESREGPGVPTATAGLSRVLDAQARRVVLRPGLRSRPARVPPVRTADADRGVHHRARGDRPDPGAPGGAAGVTPCGAGATGSAGRDPTPPSVAD